MNVANILPGDDVQELHYTELVVPTEGATSSSSPPWSARGITSRDGRRRQQLPGQRT
jgi:hypothetical protein